MGCKRGREGEIGRKRDNEEIRGKEIRVKKKDGGSGARSMSRKEEQKERMMEKERQKKEDCRERERRGKWWKRRKDRKTV